jgi:hypothetical protein
VLLGEIMFRYCLIDDSVPLAQSNLLGVRADPEKILTGVYPLSGSTSSISLQDLNNFHSKYVQIQRDLNFLSGALGPHSAIRRSAHARSHILYV